MKKLLHLAAGVLFTGILTAQSVPTIPNGGFENWTATTWQDPQYYSTANDQIVPNGGTANVTETTGYLGVNYGVMLETVLDGNNGIQPGYILNGNANGNGIQGGVPYSQMPTGIRFYYKYSTTSADTAAVLVIFKKSGSVIDSFLITLSTLASTYTLHSYYPSHSLSVAPDTVVFGAVSSLAALSHGNGSQGVVGSTLVIDSVTFTGVSSQPANLNGDFQSWTADSIVTPNNWYISYPNATKTTTAQSGLYAIQLVTSEVNNVGPGQASTGYYSNCNGNCVEQGGQSYVLPVSGIDTIKFAYTYAPMSTDTADIQVSFIYHGQQAGGSGISLYKSQTTYKDTFLVFNEGSAMIDTAIINIASSSHNFGNNSNNSAYAPYVGSTLKIDNIYFQSQQSADLAVKNITATGGIKIYPNPTNSQVNIDLSSISGSVQTITVYDMSGRVLTTQNYMGGVRNSLETIDMSSFTNGVYLIKAITTNGNFYQKVVKE